MTEMENVLNELKVAKIILCNQQMLTPEMCVKVGQVITNAIDLLTKQESEWLEDSDPGQEYGTTWACRKCGNSKHEPFIWNPYECKLRFCPWCGRMMVKELKEGENAKAD